MSSTERMRSSTLWAWWAVLSSSAPVPFPPEPVRNGVIQLTRWSIARADRNNGRRNLLLRALDRMGVGFDS